MLYIDATTSNSLNFDEGCVFELIKIISTAFLCIM
jgi:hypothetical protein